LFPDETKKYPIAFGEMADLSYICNLEVLLSTEGGLHFINFFRKLMKTKRYSENPANPV